MGFQLHSLNRSAGAAIANAADLGVKQKPVFSQSGSLTSEIQVWAGLVPPEAFLLRVLAAVFSYVLIWASVHVCVLISSHKDTRPCRLGPALVTLHNLNYIPNGPLSTRSHGGAHGLDCLIGGSRFGP